MAGIAFARWWATSLALVVVALVPFMPWGTDPGANGLTEGNAALIASFVWAILVSGSVGAGVMLGMSRDLD